MQGLGLHHLLGDTVPPRAIVKDETKSLDHFCMSLSSSCPSCFWWTKPWSNLLVTIMAISWAFLLTTLYHFLQEITSEMLPHLPLNSLLLPKVQWDLFLAALVMTIRTILPWQSSSMPPHFYPPNNPAMQVSAPFCRGGKWASESLGRLLKVILLIRMVWDWSQDQSDFSIKSEHLTSWVGDIIGYISISKEFGNGL